MYSCAPIPILHLPRKADYGKIGWCTYTDPEVASIGLNEKRAAKAGFGKEPAFIREGGSIGAVVTMQKAWKVPILFMGLSLPEHGYHAPNEYFDWGQASSGMTAFAHYFEELAKMGKG